MEMIPIQPQVLFHTEAHLATDIEVNTSKISDQTNNCTCTSQPLTEPDTNDRKPWHSPADLKVAEARGKKRSRLYAPNLEQKIVRICSVHGPKPELKPVRVCSPSSEFARYPSYELYLDLVKLLIWMVTGLILLSVFWDYLEYRFCDSSAWFLNETALGDCNYLNELAFIKFVSNIIFSLVLHFILYRLDVRRDMKYQHHHLTHVSEKEYCFLVRNIKPMVKAAKLARHIEDKIIREPNTIRNIFFLKNTANLKEKIKEIKNPASKKKLFSFSEDSKDPEFNGCAIVVCNYAFEASSTLARMKELQRRSPVEQLIPCLRPKYRVKELNFQGRLIEASELEDPSDIIWDNLQYSPQRVFAMTFIAYIVGTLMVGAFFWFSEFVSIQSSSGSTEYVQAFIFSALVQIIQIVLPFLIEYFGSLVKFSGERANIRFQFVISIILSYLSCSLAYMLQTMILGQEFLLLHKSLQTIGIGFAFASLEAYFPMGYIWNLFQRWRLKSGCKKNKKTQFRADRLFATPEFQMPNRVNQLCQPVFLAMTVYMKYPIVLPCALVFLIVNLYLDKHALISRWRKSKRDQTPDIACELYFPLNLVLLIQTTANLLFASDLTLMPSFDPQKSIYCEISIIVLFFEVLIVFFAYTLMSILMEGYTPRRKIRTSDPYSKVWHRFGSTYRSTYPYSDPSSVNEPKKPKRKRRGRIKSVDIESYSYSEVTFFSD